MVPTNVQSLKEMVDGDGITTILQGLN